MVRTLMKKYTINYQNINYIIKILTIIRELVCMKDVEVMYILHIKMLELQNGNVTSVINYFHRTPMLEVTRANFTRTKVQLTMQIWQH